ncbi:beta family protein [Micromonospora sp. NPDC002389]|uniref:beta family protein n=1 Tax=Micromonospora sp. NPDC002389 TaxID=3154272 RepID=UPI00333203B0
MVPAHSGWATEPVYRPVLAARRGELDALGHLDDALAPLIAPILHVSELDRSVVEAVSRLPPGLVPAVDVGALPGPAGAEPLRWGVPLVPVIGLSDGAERLAAHGVTARAYCGRAVVRLRIRLDRAGPDAATTAVERIWRYARLAPEQCDLVLDCGDVCCPADVRTTESRVRRARDWARRHAWRTVSVVAGGMPPALARLPTDEPVRLDRWDWLLWRRLADLGVGFGDYGVASAAPGAEPTDRLPTVRYTDADVWWLYRWSRRGRRGDERVADLCRELVSAPHWPSTGAGFSWGDHEIVRRARRVAGAGSATNWVAWSTSHHLAHVLATLVRTSGGGARPPGSVPPQRLRGGENRRAG